MLEQRVKELEVTLTELEGKSPFVNFAQNIAQWFHDTLYYAKFI